MSCGPCQRIQPKNTQTSFMPVLVEFSILRRSKNIHVGSKDLSLYVSAAKVYGGVGGSHKWDSGMGGMLPRLSIDLPVRTGTVRFVSSLLNFQVVFAPAAKLHTIASGIASSS